MRKDTKKPLQYDSINMKFKNGQTQHDGGMYIRWDCFEKQGNYHH